MIIEYIVIGIIVISVGVILYLALKKFPILASININSIKKYQQDKIKKSLLEERLVRKIKSINIKNIINRKTRKNITENNDKNKNLFSNIYNKLRNIENKYKDSIKIQSPEKDERKDKKNKMIVLSEAEELIKKEEFKLAEEKYIEMIGLDNKYHEAYEGLADLYLKIKDYEHAKEIYKYLIKINSQDDKNENVSSKISEKTEDYNMQSISLNNTVASYYMDIGNLYLITSECQKAMKSFKEAVKLEPNNPKNLNALIEVATKLHDLVVTEETFEKLKEVNPENEKLNEIKDKINKIKKSR